MKRKSDGEVERFKGRIVGGGNLLTGNSYKRKSAPVVDFTVVLLILLICLTLKLTARHIDVNLAFLNGLIEEDRISVV